MFIIDAAIMLKTPSIAVTEALTPDG